MRCTNLTVTTWSTTNVIVEADGAFGTCEMTLPMTREQFMQSLARWDAGLLLQSAFPTLNAQQREFLKTGMPPLVQEAVFSEDEE